MSLLEQLQDRTKAAMKAGRKGEVAALRLLVSELKRSGKDEGRELSEEEELRVLRKEKKKREESAEAFRSGGRAEAAEKEEIEVALIEEFLPRRMNEAELGQLIDQVIAETGASSPKQMGQVMGLVMERGGVGVDGKTASRLVKEKLSA